MAGKQKRVGIYNEENLLMALDETGQLARIRVSDQEMSELRGIGPSDRPSGASKKVDAALRENKIVLIESEHGGRRLIFMSARHST